MNHRWTRTAEFTGIVFRDANRANCSKRSRWRDNLMDDADYGPSCCTDNLKTCVTFVDLIVKTIDILKPIYHQVSFYFEFALRTVGSR